MRPGHADADADLSDVPSSPSLRPLLGSSPAGTPAMATETVVLKVAMSCAGCSGAVKRVLSKMEGVESFDIDMEEQKVTVKGNVKPEDVFQTVSKTGKKTSFWEDEAAAPAASAPAAEAAPIPAAKAAPTDTTEAAPIPAAEAAPIPAAKAAPTDITEAAHIPAVEAAPSAAAEAPVAAPASEAAPAKADA